MTALSVVLLLVGVAGAVVRPRGLPAWVGPLAAALVALATGSAGVSVAHGALDELAQPVGFLLAAVPLAVSLDRLGFFEAAATVVTRGRGMVGGLWILAAAVTTVLNLDAGVVLLTPLYVTVARRTGRDPLLLALQPLVLSWLASSALPVSNLTNLIAVARTGASVTAFVGHLGLPSVVATAVGWCCYRYGAPARPGSLTVVAPPTSGREGPGLSPGQRRSLLIGGSVVAAVLVGFVGGRSVGIAEWEVALAADVVLIAVSRRVPWRAVPVGTAVVAAGLGVLAAGAVAHIDVARVLGGGDVAGLAQTAGVSAVAANVVNNLPALLVVLPALGRHAGPSLWAALIGVNMGPVLLATGTLASLLWLDTLGRLGVEARSTDVTRAGVRVGLPAGLAGLGTLLALHAAGVAR